MKRLLPLVIFLLAAVPTFSQQKDPLLVIKQFLGVWKGEESGKAGQGVGSREYSLILKDRFVHYRNRSIFQPQPQNPQGEVHEDWGFFSYDSGRKKVMFRQYFGEGYWIQYVEDSLSADGSYLRFVSEATENVPKGYRARLIFRFFDAGHFEERFELAPPGKDFQPFIQNKWTKIGGESDPQIRFEK